MRRRFLILGIWLPVLALAAVAQPPDPLAILKQRAEAARGGARVRLFIDLARQHLDLADQEFAAGAADRAQQRVHDALGAVEQATEASLHSGKRLKETEIELRKLQHRCDEIAHSVDFQDRPPLAAAVKKLEQLRQKLLDRMFSNKEKEKEKP